MPTPGFQVNPEYSRLPTEPASEDGAALKSSPLSPQKGGLASPSLTTAGISFSSLQALMPSLHLPGMGLWAGAGPSPRSPRATLSARGKTASGSGPAEPASDGTGVDTNGAVGNGGMSADESARLGIAKAINILGGKEKGGITIDRDSCYGAFVVMSQIGRCTGWPGSIVVLVWRVSGFLLLNYFVQLAFVYYIYDSQSNMNPFGSQMHLCDFGAHIHDCPDHPNCHGPGGTEFHSPGDLYPFDIWNTRMLLRDSLKMLFPDLQDEIDQHVQPGEYGVESYYCRLLCIWVFLLQIADEFEHIRALLMLLRALPTEDGYWVEFDNSTPRPDDDPEGDKELEKVRFKVAGIPRRWKFVFVVFVLIPRIFIWRMLTMAGVHFLMETAAIVDQIVNTTALSFVLTSDELMLERLSTGATRYILEHVETYTFYDHTIYKDMSDQDILAQFDETEMACCASRSHRFSIIPRRLVWTVFFMIVFIGEYYVHSCTRLSDGSLVSIPVHTPEGYHMGFLTFIKKFVSLEPEETSSPFWTMPAWEGES
eukprot:TRINITY_DN61825_c0_g1_i1.p1 TRINITY_DN61825_c0_g1~~TRINITY_DN61825_c0_g1_i1.p1  ORF type:complete len:538 (-),score=19.31 TRINITY_DN61825_c0_g1_i1:104-1717(-)